MSTTTAPAELEVPPELLPRLRENIRAEIAMHGQSLDESDETFDADCDELERAIAAHRALAEDSASYPRDAVDLAARHTIREAASRLSHDHPSVDEAEMLVRRVRACEALLKVTA